jgi:hypothetical protein
MGGRVEPGHDELRDSRRETAALRLQIKSPSKKTNMPARTFPIAAMPARTVADEIARLEWLADLLDSRFRIPGTQIRFGLDPLVGLVPVAGDFIGLLVSLYIVVELADLGLPLFTKLRMLTNILLDFFIGSIPLVGDVLDVAIRVNRKNLALARRALERRGRL